MRVLFSLMGPDGGTLVGEDRSITRLSLARIPHDHLHVLTVDPDHEELDRIQDLCERMGAGFSKAPIEDEDLLAAFETITEAINGFRDSSEETPRLKVQVNAGRHANLLSAAGLLACLHEGVPAHFVHEDGHDELDVLARAPLTPLLTDAQTDALAAFPEDGIPLEDLSQHDVDALTGLKGQGLVAPGEDRLELTEPGRAYKMHLQAPAGESPDEN